MEIDLNQKGELRPHRKEKYVCEIMHNIRDKCTDGDKLRGVVN